QEIYFKIRHTPEFTKGIVKKIGDIYSIASEEKIQGISAGQFGVLYDKDMKICMGSGVIQNE
ncbi:MAG: tRNA 2-thiouridine(34) synthase MnmA, partial [Bacteroidales bacterium]|nr:tRNA 2-thiouridine(34) synthase MnmA [Bacteroidales bacterium]